MMSYFRFFFLLTSVLMLISQFPIEVSAQNNDPHSGFSTTLAECGTQYNVKINRSVSERAEEAVQGNSRLDLQAFLNIFPESDRLKAYSIFQECLARRYQLDRTSGSLDLNKRLTPITTEFPDITNKSFDVSGTVSTVGNPERRFPFHVSRVCEIFIMNGRLTGFNYGWRIEDDLMNYVDSAFLGSNPKVKRVTVGAGNYYFILKARADGNYNSFHEGSIEARCK